MILIQLVKIIFTLIIHQNENLTILILNEYEVEKLDLKKIEDSEVDFPEVDFPIYMGKEKIN